MDTRRCRSECRRVLSLLSAHGALKPVNEGNLAMNSGLTLFVARYGFGPFSNFDEGRLLLKLKDGNGPEPSSDLLESGRSLREVVESVDANMARYLPMCALEIRATAIVQ